MKNVLRLLAICAAFAAFVAATPTHRERVVLAGGCFWGMQAVFEQLRGVTSVVAGYSGGSRDTAHYDIVESGNTGHAESVDITYDPSRISFKQILDVYFLVAHDPTQLNRQGPDEGTQYRSEIFYTTNAQRAAAEQYIAQLQRAHTYSSPIVTKVAALSGFYPAEQYHQDFVVHNPDNPYVVYNDKPKLAHLRERFPSLLKN
jgi:peptide-methionine (S)-S-oxide reductase